MKVYVTVPTHEGAGVTADLVQWLLTLPKWPGVEWHCDLVRDKPVVSTRNRTVKRFLESDCDVFFSIDDDMIPMIDTDPKHGGLNMMLEDIRKPEVDVLTAMALKRVKRGTLPVLMKMVGPYKQRTYHEILDKPKGLHRMKGGASGAASLMVKRHVMEKFRDENVPWFMDVFSTDDSAEDDFGERKLGQDAWFWIKAEEFGFGCYCDTRIHWGHVKMSDLRIDFNREQHAYASEMRLSRLPLCFAECARRLWGNTDFSSSSEFLTDALLYAADVPQDQMIVECGSGVSTLALSMILTPDRYHVYEHDPEWRAYALNKQEYLGEVIYTCPLEDKGDYDWYKRKLDPHLPVGLLIVDGPPFQNRGHRDGAMREMFPFLAQNYRVMLDDVHLDSHEKTMASWIEEYGLTVEVHRSGDGRQHAIMSGVK